MKKVSVKTEEDNRVEFIAQKIAELLVSFLDEQNTLKTTPQAQKQAMRDKGG